MIVPFYSPLQAIHLSIVKPSFDRRGQQAVRHINLFSAGLHRCLRRSRIKFSLPRFLSCILLLFAKNSSISLFYKSYKVFSRAFKESPAQRKCSDHMQIIMSGLDYNLAPIGLREQLSFTKAQVEALTERIRRDVKGVLGCVLVSTCNRTELYLSCASDSTLCPDQILCHAVKLSHAHLPERS